MTKHLICVIGPTAIGKTSLSIKLAKHFNTEIISNDSRQFYKEMCIGTAVPSKEELKMVKHHFIQNKSITEDYSVGAFEKEAIELLDALFKKHDIVVLVGGSGLYMDAILKGLDEFPEVPQDIRDHLNLQIKNGEIESLKKKLKEVDFESYKTIDLNNPQRLVRALEIYLATGKPFSFYKGIKKSERIFTPVKIGLSAPRELIYERINKRVDQMMTDGLLDEAKNLLRYKALNALQTVGYKELFPHLEGKYSLELAIEEIKKNTRRFAKRQLTWNRKDSEIHWFDYQVAFEEIINSINLAS